MAFPQFMALDPHAPPPPLFADDVNCVHVVHLQFACENHVNIGIFVAPLLSNNPRAATADSTKLILTAANAATYI